MKKGDLLYIPSEVRLLQFKPVGKKMDTIRDVHMKNVSILDKPTNVLYLDKLGENFFKVLHDGEEWLVDKKDAIFG
jgi:hypothetical protein